MWSHLDLLNLKNSMIRFSVICWRAFSIFMFLWNLRFSVSQVPKWPISELRLSNLRFFSGFSRLQSMAFNNPNITRQRRSFKNHYFEVGIMKGVRGGRGAIKVLIVESKREKFKKWCIWFFDVGESWSISVYDDLEHMREFSSGTKTFENLNDKQRHINDTTVFQIFLDFLSDAIGPYLGGHLVHCSRTRFTWRVLTQPAGFPSHTPTSLPPAHPPTSLPPLPTSLPLPRQTPTLLAYT